LGLIQDHSLLESAQKAARILRGEGTLVGIFERDVLMVRKDGSNQGGLAGLTRAGEQYNGVLLGRGPQLPLQMTLDHERAPCSSVCKFNIGY
jgi:hypothetical protein